MELSAAWWLHLIGWGSVAILAAGAVLVLALFIAPYTFLKDHPADIQAAARPATAHEQRAARYAGAIFMVVLLLTMGGVVAGWALAHRGGGFGELLAMAAILILAFDLFDLVVIDWLLICTLRPRGVLIPGSEDCAGWRDWRHHYRELLRWRALAVVAIGSLLLAGGAWLISR